MRRFATLLLIACAAVAWAGGAAPLHAQAGGGGAGDDQGDDDARTRQRNEEWGSGANNLALPALRNGGPCPFVKVLYDAARYVELKDNQETAQAVGFTGEIENLSSACEYKSNDPIKVQVRLLFELGRGPQADGAAKTYRYWIAVTDRDRAVLGKEYFSLPVTFPPGQDRVQVTQDIMGITIPRGNARVSGGNFEVLVGFDVTPEMADFNREGKRFFANAGVAKQP